MPTENDIPFEGLVKVDSTLIGQYRDLLSDKRNYDKLITKLKEDHLAKQKELYRFLDEKYRPSFEIECREFLDEVRSISMANISKKIEAKSWIKRWIYRLIPYLDKTGERIEEYRKQLDREISSFHLNREVSYYFSDLGNRETYLQAKQDAIRSRYREILGGEPYASRDLVKINFSLSPWWESFEKYINVIDKPSDLRHRQTGMPAELFVPIGFLDFLKVRAHVDLESLETGRRYLTEITDEIQTRINVEKGVFTTTVTFSTISPVNSDGKEHEV